MDIQSEITKSRPLTAFRLNAAATAYVDATGRGVALSATPSMTSVGLVAGSVKSSVIAAATTFNFPTKIFRRTQEKRGFTLQATVSPLDTVTTFISVLSHNGVEDGLYIKNNRLSFTVEFNSLGTVTVSYPLDIDDGALTVHAVYSVSKIQLYINGILKSEAEITPAMVADGFKTRASSNLYIGQGTAGKRYLLDAVAVYARALEKPEIVAQADGARRLVSHRDNYAPYNFSSSMDGASDSRNIYTKQEWSSDWTINSTGADVGYTDVLVPSIDEATGLTKAGTWTVPIMVNDIPTIYGAVARWRGVGTFVVELSLNGGTSWTAMTDNYTLPSTYNVATSGIDPVVRIRFLAGEAPGTSYVSYFSFTVYASANVATTDQNKIGTASAGVATFDTDFGGVIGQGRVGTTVADNNTLVLPADATAETTFDTIEMWVKFDSIVSSQYVFDMRSGVSTYLWLSTISAFAFPVGTLYINGVQVTSGTFNVQKNVWYHVVYVLTAPFNQPITLGPKVVGGSNDYAVVNLYQGLTAAQITTLFNSYVQFPNVRVATDANPVTEQGFSTYQYEWALTPAGF